MASERQLSKVLRCRDDRVVVAHGAGDWCRRAAGHIGGTGLGGEIVGRDLSGCRRCHGRRCVRGVEDDGAVGSPAIDGKGGPG